MFSAPVSAGRREAAEVADDLLDLITLDDLNEEQRQLAELIGLEDIRRWCAPTAARTSISPRRIG